MKKDVIYIDTEDDITSIIEKAKSSKEKIIALVPPKRVGVLQSAVNLKLLHKAAASVDKRIVLITSDKSLAALAAGVQIPVAKTLQSRPELATTTAPEVDTEDVINGEELPVGELEKTVDKPPISKNDEEITLPDDLGKEAAVAPVRKSSKKPKKGGVGVPNFNKFRKKLFLIAGGAIFLILFLVWAIVFAPHATVNIKAKTDVQDINLPLSLRTDAATNLSQSVIQPQVQQVKKTNSVDFSATGKKDVGEKASGTVTLQNCGSRDAVGIPAGTAVSSDGLNFFTASSVTVPGGRSSSPFGGCDRPGTVSVAVSAQDVGEQYNLQRGSTFSVAGQGSGVSATNSSAISGGSKRQITIVSDSDVAAAQQKINGQDQTPVRQELAAKFNKDQVVIINDSFNVAPGAPSVNPGVGNEASGGRVTIETTYTLFAISKKDLSGVLNEYLKDKIKNQEDQQVYDDGSKEAKLTNYALSEGGGTVQVSTKGYTGPKINDKALKPQLVGKNYEEIRQKIKVIDGVEDVDTKFSPFWVSTAPDEKKIDIKFNVSKNGSDN